MDKQNFQCSKLCPLPFALSLDNKWEELDRCFFIPPAGVYNMHRIFLSFLNPSSLSFSYDTCSQPLIILVAFHWTSSGTSMFLLVENPKLNTILQM